MRALSTFIALLFACSSWGATFSTYTVTFTNTTANGDSVTVSGTTARFTNAPINSTTWIQSGSSNSSATNFLQWLGANKSGLTFAQASSNVVTVAGLSLTATISGPFGYIQTNSSTATNAIALIPWDNHFATNRTNNADELIYGLNKYARTNAFSQSAQALTNFVSRTNAQAVSHKVLDLSLLTGSAVSNSYLTNITRANVGAFRATNAILHGGFATNTALVNSPSAVVTNLTAYGGYLSNFIGHSISVTNFSAPGSGADSTQIGDGATATGDRSLAFGVNAAATNEASISIGYDSRASSLDALALGSRAIATSDLAVAIGAGSVARGTASISIGSDSTAAHDTSVAIGFEATTTTNFQIRLGRSSEHVSIPGEVRDVKLTNVWNTGTNRFDLAVAFTRTNITTLANGANLVDPGLKTYLKVSGPSAGYSIDKLQRGWDGRRILIQKNDAFTLTIANESGSGGGTDADRILTGTGGNVTITNAPGFVELIYDSAASRWGVISKSN